MVSASLSLITRQIGWNGLRFDLPKAWEAVVAGPRHLLVEHDLAPLFEMRWQPRDPRAAKDLPTIIRQVTGVAGDLRPSSPPAPFDRLPFAELVGLAAPGSTGQSGLGWRCRECGMVFLVLFHADAYLIEQHLPGLLASLACHQEPQEPSLWAVQDFRLELPSGYSFIDSTFKAGLSRLAFAGSGLRLTFCRLAPASARLSQTTMADLLQTMMGTAKELEVLSDDSIARECQTHVSSGRQLAGRLLGRYLFSWGRIWHDRASDRLLALLVDSCRPIDRGLAASLCERYEILR